MQCARICTTAVLTIRHQTLGMRLTSECSSLPSLPSRRQFTMHDRSPHSFCGLQSEPMDIMMAAWLSDKFMSAMLDMCMSRPLKLHLHVCRDPAPAPARPYDADLERRRAADGLPPLSAPPAESHRIKGEREDSISRYVDLPSPARPPSACATCSIHDCVTAVSLCQALTTI